jgi:hypothetical protein
MSVRLDTRGERETLSPYHSRASCSYLLSLPSFTIRPRDAAILAGIVSLLAVWWVWGAVVPLRGVSDEHS